MADAGSKKGKRRGAAADEAALAAALATGLPAAMFTGPGLMALVRPAAGDDRLRRPRGALPLLEQGAGRMAGDAARRGAGQDHGRSAGRGRVRGAAGDVRGGAGRGAAVLRGELRSSHARADRGAERLCAVGQSGDRRRRRGRHRRHRHHRAALDRTGAAGERGAVPPDRQFRPGDDVGDPARPRARLRQRPLCRVRRRHSRGSVPARLADADSSRRRRAHRLGEHRRGSDVAAVHARGPLPPRRRGISLAPQRVAAAA